MIAASSTITGKGASRNEIGTGSLERNRGLTLFKPNLMIKEMPIEIIKSNGLGSLLNRGDKGIIFGSKSSQKKRD